MNLSAFYSGDLFDAYEVLGAHCVDVGTCFRVYAPNAESVGLIGEFNGWQELPMHRVYDGNFYELVVPSASSGMRYKYRVHEHSGRCLDRSDPYGFGTEKRPNTASVIRRLHAYRFRDELWMSARTDGMTAPINIYEVHLGSWRRKEGQPLSYRELAEALSVYAVENGYTHLELMPLCEYPSDASWGYQATGFFAPTSRYGDMDDLKYFVDLCHQRGLGVILDFAPVHFAVDDFGLADFDGSALYEYPYPDVGWNEWGSKNFNHSRGDICSFLQSAIYYWLREYHFDGVRLDAVSNLVYWQGNAGRGENQGALRFLRKLTLGIKTRLPEVMLIAEDSSTYPGLTRAVRDGGLGFDYKWDMGWMNDTLSYFQTAAPYRGRDYHKLTFSMMYFGSEHFLLPLSHDEVVHGKGTIVQKMSGKYEEKFAQARACYLYQMTHPGKKLNFMGNEIGQLREWDEKREQDWDLLRFPIHSGFHRFMKELNHLYIRCPALWEKDYSPDGFQWADCSGETPGVYAFLRRGSQDQLLAVFNFSDKEYASYQLQLSNVERADILMDTEWGEYGGSRQKVVDSSDMNEPFVLTLAPFSGKLFSLKEKSREPIQKQGEDYL